MESSWFFLLILVPVVPLALGTIYYCLRKRNPTKTKMQRNLEVELTKVVVDKQSSERKRIKGSRESPGPRKRIDKVQRFDVCQTYDQDSLIEDTYNEIADQAIDLTNAAPAGFRKGAFDSKVEGK